MPGRLHPHVELLRAQCTALREVSRIIHVERPRPHVAAAARASVEAIEPLALALIDEEFAHVPRVAEIIVSSCSPLLVEKLSEIHGNPLLIKVSEWRTLLANSDPKALERMIDGTVKADNLACPLLDRLSVDDTHLGLVPVAAKSDGFFNMTPDPVPILIDVRRPNEVASFLRVQVEAFPEDYLRAASRAARDGDIAWLALLFLAGVDLGRVEGRPDPDCARIIAKASSNHGALELRAMIGSLEKALDDGQSALCHALGPVVLAA